MRKRISLVLAALLLVLTLFPLASCGSDDVIELNIYNWEEYISEEDEEWGTFDIIGEFENYASEALGKTVKVNYSTFGTNENMYNELQLTKRTVGGEYRYNYDLVCPSDYMIQRMIREGMVEKLDLSLIPNYTDNVSGFIWDLFEENGWTEYATCYMWGTMGFIYNKDRMMEEKLAKTGEEWSDDDAHSWEFPWKEYAQYLGTIKDSIRDTYALAVGYVYREELLTIAEMFENELFDEDEYRNILVKIFNNIDKPIAEELKELDLSDEVYNSVAALFEPFGEATVDMAGKALKELKRNVYGFEVDSGKKDMASGKIAINFAWSGDAALVLDEVDELNEELPEDEQTILYYAVPYEGSNIWFDGWVMPKGRDEEHRKLAHMFLDFIADPESAISNMDYIGYVSSIAGDDVFARLVETYDLTPFDESEQDDGYHTYEIDYGYYFTDLDEENEDYVFYLGEDGEVCVWDGEEDLEGVDNTWTIAKYVSYDEDGTRHVYVYMDEEQVDRQLTTQYPEPSTVARCAIMTDFNKHDLERINAMWSDVKVGEVPMFLLIGIPVVIVLLIVLGIVLSVLKKKGVTFRRKQKDYGELIKSEEIRKK